jgi:hypothetical protein
MFMLLIIVLNTYVCSAIITHTFLYQFFFSEHFNSLYRFKVVLAMV